MTPLQQGFFAIKNLNFLTEQLLSGAETMFSHFFLVHCFVHYAGATFFFFFCPLSCAPTVYSKSSYISINITWGMLDTPNRLGRLLMMSAVTCAYNSLQ